MDTIRASAPGAGVQAASSTTTTSSPATSRGEGTSHSVRSVFTSVIGRGYRLPPAIVGAGGDAARRDILQRMPVLHSRLGDWELDHVHAWSERELVIRAPADR